MKSKKTKPAVGPTLSAGRPQCAARPASLGLHHRLPKRAELGTRNSTGSTGAARHDHFALRTARGLTVGGRRQRHTRWRGRRRLDGAPVAGGGGDLLRGVRGKVKHIDDKGKTQEEAMEGKLVGFTERREQRWLEPYVAEKMEAKGA
jgi:hypothetical protein